MTNFEDSTAKFNPDLFLKAEIVFGTDFSDRIEIEVAEFHRNKAFYLECLCAAYYDKTRQYPKLAEIQREEETETFVLNGISPDDFNQEVNIPDGHTKLHTESYYSMTSIDPCNCKVVVSRPSYNKSEPFILKVSYEIFKVSCDPMS